jgi:3-dehydroquinate dehydratase/shikimate dehydrogenase
MHETKLCVTVTAATTAELRERRDRVVGAELVELRLDTVRDPSAAGALSGRRTPVIVTCRPEWEGGEFRGSEDERHAVLREAQALGAEFIDVEFRARFDDLIAARNGRGVVISLHEFAGVPSDLAVRYADMRTTGAEIVKLAVMAGRLTDCIILGAITKDSGHPTVAIAMGEAGLATRILPSRFGSLWTYAGDGVAPGQIAPERLLGEFSLRSTSERTAIFGVVGRPVGHSISPAIHNAAFQATGIDAVYLPLAAADFDDFLSFADALSIAGGSVTAPFKLDALRAGDADALSARVGAANTLRRRDGRWQACNTDVAGFLEPLRSRLPLHGLRATLLGAGGAARAAGVAMRGAGAEVTFCARRRERATAVAEATHAAVADWPPLPGSWDLLVNTTPVGTFPDVDDSPIPNTPLDGRIVYDLVYNPPETRLLRDARRAGCLGISGLEMLIAQARHQFEWWTGVAAPVSVMRSAALNALGERRRGLASMQAEAPSLGLADGL